MSNSPILSAKNDHELLIRIDERIDQLQKAHIVAVEAALEEIKARQTQDERNDERFKKLESFLTAARNGLVFLAALGAVVQFSVVFWNNFLKYFTLKQ